MVDAAPVMPTQAALRRRELVPVALPRAASDQRLVEQVRAGSDRAFEALFDRHHRSVLAFCRHMLDSREEAEDAVQLTFMAAYRDLVDAAQPRALRPWLFGIARHRCISALRLRRQRSAQTIAEPLADHVGSEVLAREDLRAILADMAELPDDQRAALVLAELGGLPHEEIAQVLGCRRQKVKALVFQARASLVASRVARDTPCAEIREQLATLRGGALRRSALRRHLRDCAACQAFHDEVSSRRRLARVLLPATPTLGVKRAVVGALFGGGGEGSAALTVGALGTSGLAAVALATAAIHAGGGAAAVTPPRNAAAPVIEQSGWMAPRTAGNLAAVMAVPAPTRSHDRVSRKAASATLPAREPGETGGSPGQADAAGSASDGPAHETVGSPADADRTQGDAPTQLADGVSQAATTMPPASPTLKSPPAAAAQPDPPLPAAPSSRSTPTGQANPPQASATTGPQQRIPPSGAPEAPARGQAASSQPPAAATPREAASTRPEASPQKPDGRGAPPDAGGPPSTPASRKPEPFHANAAIGPQQPTAPSRAPEATNRGGAASAQPPAAGTPPEAARARPQASPPKPDGRGGPPDSGAPANPAAPPSQDAPPHPAAPPSPEPSHNDAAPPSHPDAAPPSHNDAAPPSHPDAAPPDHNDAAPPSHPDAAPPSHADAAPPDHPDAAPPDHNADRAEASGRGPAASPGPRG